MTEPSKALLHAAVLRPEGTVLVLLTSGGQRRWAADVAIELSARWAEGGRRIVLADLHLENPLLHVGLDVSNLEGVVDIFLYGASLARIARPVRDQSFYLIPAGTYAPDLEEIYRHPRWKKLVAGFKDTDATLILFAPADSADLEALSRWSSEAIILGSSDAELRERLARVSMRVLTVVDPEDPAASPAAAAAATPAELPTFDDRAPVIEPPDSEEPAHPETSPAKRAPAVQLHRPPESELELPPPPVRRRPERRSTSVILWILFILILLGTIGYLVGTVRPDLFDRFIGTRVTAVAATAPEEAAPVAAPTRQGELLPYSVQVRAFPSLNGARGDLATVRGRLPSVPFFISPEDIQGILYYRILSGMAADTSAAIRLRDRLVEIGAVNEEDAVGSWSLIQFTPLAFDLGEFPTLERAGARADSLLAAEIPTYPAAVEYSDGSTRWRLYAGAYPDSASAFRMREMLSAAGLDAPLSARTGIPAALPE